MIGARLSSGPVLSARTTSFSQPHWNTAVVAPSAEPIVSRKPRTPTTGTAIERNTSTSRTNASPTTSSRYTGSASARVADTSTLTAVWPVTYARSPSRSPPAISSRIRCTRSVVASSSGAVVGTTVTSAAVPAGFGVGGVDQGHAVERRRAAR